MRQRPYFRFGAAISVLLLASGCSTYYPGGAQGATAGSMNTNESNPGNTHPDRMYVAPRGDNPNLPNPVTPSAANESAPQPQGTLRNPTNVPGR
jgi:hypothetical protein